MAVRRDFSSVAPASLVGRSFQDGTRQHSNDRRKLVLRPVCLRAPLSHRALPSLGQVIHLRKMRVERLTAVSVQQGRHPWDEHDTHQTGVSHKDGGTGR